MLTRVSNCANMFLTRDSVLFLAAAFFPAKFICTFRNISRKKIRCCLVSLLSLQAGAYFFTHFLLFIFFLVIKYNSRNILVLIFFLVIKYNSRDINLVLEIVVKLIKIFDFWSNHMVHADMSDQLIIMEVDFYQNDKDSKVRTILRIICFYW